MNNTFRFALVAASVLVLTSPVLAQNLTQSDRTYQRSMSSQRQGQVMAPAAMRRDSTYQTYEAPVAMRDSTYQTYDSSDAKYTQGGNEQSECAEPVMPKEHK